MHKNHNFIKEMHFCESQTDFFDYCCQNDRTNDSCIQNMEKKKLLIENMVFIPQWKRVETSLFTEKSTEITTLISFSWWIFLCSTDHSAHPELVSQHNIKWRRKHWVVFFPLLTQTCLLTLNGTLCVSLLVLEWVWRHTETRLGSVLQRDGIAQYLPKRWIHWVSWVKQETLPWTRVLEREQPAWLLTLFCFNWPALLPALLLLGGNTVLKTLSHRSACDTVVLSKCNLL